jgi:protein-S-isoprenylcysteine O-methyltransferase Ste14
MGATKIEFKLRMVIMTALIVLGFWAPWIEAWGVGRRISLMEWAATELARSGLVPFADAIPLVICTAALVAALAVVLRVSGTAYLGAGVVQHGEMKAGAVLADGPYRMIRNPLYLGSWFMTGAMAFLMPVSGAVFATVLVGAFLMRLILGEEGFLSVQLGEPYRAYLNAVPRLVPRLRSGLEPAGAKPHWLRAMVAEINPIGIFLILAVLSWSYDNRLMVRAILVCFGISLVVRALMSEPEA